MKNFAIRQTMATARSNRTFMELKFALQKYKEIQNSSSNRTFMELKSFST